MSFGYDSNWAPYDTPQPGAAPVTSALVSLLNPAPVEGGDFERDLETIIQARDGELLEALNMTGVSSAVASFGGLGYSHPADVVSDQGRVAQAPWLDRLLRRRLSPSSSTPPPPCSADPAKPSQFSVGALMQVFSGAEIFPPGIEIRPPGDDEGPSSATAASEPGPQSSATAPQYTSSGTSAENSSASEKTDEQHRRFSAYIDRVLQVLSRVNPDPGKEDPAAAQWAIRDAAPLLENMAEFLVLFETSAMMNATLHPPSPPTLHHLLTKILEKLGPRIVAAYGLGTVTDARSSIKVIICTILDVSDQAAPLYEGLFEANAYSLWLDLRSKPQDTADWSRFFESAKKNFLENIIMQKIVKGCLPLVTDILYALNKSSASILIDGLLHGDIMPFLKGCSSTKFKRSILRFISSFRDIHRIVIQRTRHSNYDIPQKWMSDSDSDGVTLGLGERALERLKHHIENAVQPKKRPATTRDTEVPLWPLDAGEDQYFFFSLFRSRALDCAIDAHLDGLEEASPGALQFIHDLASLPDYKHVLIKLYLAPIILVGGVLFQSAMNASPDISADDVLTDPAALSVMAIRTLFCDQAIEEFLTRGEFAIQRERLLDFVWELLKSKIAPSAKTTEQVAEELRGVCEGHTMSQYPGSSAALTSRPVAGRMRTLHSISHSSMLTRPASSITPGNVTIDRAGAGAAATTTTPKALWTMVDDRTSRSGARGTWGGIFDGAVARLMESQMSASSSFA